jgi:hypothetical protein
MTYVTIDRATAMMVPAFLSTFGEGETFAWARDCAQSFTKLTLFTEHTSFSSNPTPDRSPSGLWGEFTTGIAGYCRADTRVAEPTKLKALATTRDVIQTPDYLKHWLESVAADPSYSSWLIWHARFEMVEHSQRLNGLFEPQFADLLADALGERADQLMELHARTQQPRYVQGLARRILDGRTSRDDATAINAFVAGTLIRGIFQEEIARLRNRQNHSHPMRSPRLRGIRTVSAEELYAPSPAETYFAAILLGLALKASKDHVDRIRLYSLNVHSAKRALRSGEAALAGAIEMSDEVGLSRAAQETRSLIKAGVLDAGGKREALAIDVALGLASTSVAFTLSPWAALFVGAGTVLGSTLLKPGDHIKAWRRSRPKALGDLAKAVAGSVDLQILE